MNNTSSLNRMFNLLRTRQAVFSHDLLMIPLAWLGSYWLRFNLENIPQPFLKQALNMLPLVMLIQGGLFWYFNLYKGVWRFASLPDLTRIVKAVAAGVTVVAFIVLLLTRLQDVPRSIFLLDGILLVLLLGSPRFIYRWLIDRHLYVHSGKKVLIVGAGHAGEMLARDLLRNSQQTYQPVAFVDDDLNKDGKDIHGVPVLGSCNEIHRIINENEVHLILIAMPSATSRQMQRVVGICESADIPFRILPRMQDLVSGQVSVRELRDVKIEDLLGRDPIRLDWEAIIRANQEKTILVTGGGGSIGAELCRQIARLKPARLILFERSEFNLYSIDIELRRDYPEMPLVTILGDVCDYVAVERALNDYSPSVIFHAAAYKHVPMLEDQVRAAVMNNVLGTRTLASLADKYGCESFIMISTDKAVNPANIMGASKRVAEIYCQSLNINSRTRFITVRFGNVLGSSGSVIPLFQQQIAHGGPVTVTHPDITRYFMTIPEACQLILQAGIIGKGGEIFVLDMGEPVKISYLAEQLIRLSGKKPGEDVEIVYTGLRPGEKLYEELFHASEKLLDTGHPKILLAHCRQVDKESLEQTFDAMNKACEEGDDVKVVDLLSKLVPEHTGMTGSVFESINRIA